jgi:DNA (cytosine-5)-methyltransferase 1
MRSRMSLGLGGSMRVGSLFSGIGGLDLGFEWAGMQTAWQVEKDPYALKVLQKHWPEVPRYDDIRQFNAANAPGVDLVCGGFPCQPHSLAGKRGASGDERDLWGEMWRVIREAGSRWVVAENVPGLLSSEAGRYFGRVLRDLAEGGYDASWFVLPAAAVGAPHRRGRVFIVAHAHGAQRKRDGGTGRVPTQASFDSRSQQKDLGNADGVREPQPQGGEQNERGWPGDPGWWAVEPDVGRVAHGIPARVDRLRCLGNAVVPQVAYQIGKAIMKMEARYA